MSYRILNNTIREMRRVINILIMSLIFGFLPIFGQKTITIPDFTRLDDIKEFASSIKTIRGFNHYEVEADLAAYFYNDPAIYLFKGDELDKSFYKKSQQYINDSQTWVKKKQRPLCMIINLKLANKRGEVSDVIKDFTPNNFTLRIASAALWDISTALHKRYAFFGGIYFPTKSSARKDLIKDEKEINTSYSFIVPCSKTEKLLSIRERVQNNPVDDLYKVVILYTPGCVRNLTINSGNFMVRGTHTYYFGKVLKAYLICDNMVIEDLTKMFGTFSSSIIDSTILPAEKSYKLNKYQ